MKIDELDRKILRVLQLDATIALDNLGEKVGLSRNACWRRVKALDTAGVISRRVTLLNAEKLGMGLTVFVHVRAAQQDSDWLENFHAVTESTPEIMEVYRMSGTTDYLLRVQLSDVANYDRLARKLASRIAPAEISASFVLEEIKHTTALPL